MRYFPTVDYLLQSKKPKNLGDWLRLVTDGDTSPDMALPSYSGIYSIDGFVVTPSDHESFPVQTVHDKYVEYAATLPPEKVKREKRFLTHQGYQPWSLPMSTVY